MPAAPFGRSTMVAALGPIASEPIDASSAALPPEQPASAAINGAPIALRIPAANILRIGGSFFDTTPTQAPWLVASYRRVAAPRRPCNGGRDGNRHRSCKH